MLVDLAPHDAILAKRVGEQLDYEWFVQGDAPKQTLLDRFRDQGNAVFFATASFWEGVDVPGSALRLVVIDKLPFDVPSDPVVAARCERLDEAGESSFMRYLVPAAALSLKQGFGRLIRTTQDRGVVAILDSRIRRKGYGKVFLRSLPPARVCDTLDEVREFLISASRHPNMPTYLRRRRRHRDSSRRPKQGSAAIPEAEHRIEPTSQSKLDEALAILEDHKQEWAALDIDERIELLEHVREARSRLPSDG